MTDLELPEKNPSSQRRLYGLGLVVGITKAVYRKLRKWIRRLSRLKRLRSKLPTSENLVRKYPDLVGALSDDFPRGRYMLRPEAIAFLVGDYALAMKFANRRAKRGDSQALFIALVSEWSLDPDGRADVEMKVRDMEETSGDSALASVARFYVYLERPSEAQRVLDTIAGPGEALLRIVGSAWRRHGEPERAIKVLSHHNLAQNNGVAQQVHAAEGEQAAVSWNWALTPQLAGSVGPVPGRVLHMVSRSLPHHHAGSTYRTHYTISAQRDSGIDAHVVTECGFPPSRSLNGKHSSELYDGIEYLRLPESLSSRRLDDRLKEHGNHALALVSGMRPAVLHPHSDFKNAAVALSVGGHLGIPVVYEVRGFPEIYLPRRPASSMLYERHGLRKRMEVECWHRADRIVTLAEVMKDHIASFGVNPDKIEVVPNAVDIDKFTPTDRDPSLARQLNLDDCDIVLGYVSSLTAPYEGVQYLIAAIAELKRQNVTAKALIVGGGSEQHHLTEFAARLGVRDEVVFTGRVDHGSVAQHYALIDIFVVPRTSEATTELVTPLKPLEAMAMERAVVVSGTAALREMIVEGETGLSYRPDDVTSLVATVEPLIEDAPRRRKLGSQAREWVAENRSWKHNAERYRSLYEGLGIAA